MAAEYGRNPYSNPDLEAFRANADRLTPRLHQPVFLKHHLTSDEPLALARNIIEQYCISQEQTRWLDIVFTPQGEWRYTNTSGPHPYSFKDPTKLGNFLIEKFHGPQMIANLALRDIRIGFNGHDRSHISEVTSLTDDFMKKIGLGRTTTHTAAVIAATIHDLGNIVTRDGHALVSCAIAALTDPRLLDNKEIWSEVEWAVEHHDSDIIDLAFNKWEGLRPSQIVERMSEEFPKSALALTAADKLDVGPHRVSRHLVDSDDAVALMDGDKHAQVQYLLKTAYAGFSHKNRAFQWVVHYNETRTEEDKQNQGALVRPRNRHEGLKVHVPKDVHTPYREDGTPHMDTVANKFHKISLSRNKLLIMSLFALCNDLEEVNITLVDMPYGIDSKFEGAKKIFPIARANIDNAFNYLDTLFVDKEQR